MAGHLAIPGPGLLVTFLVVLVLAAGCRRPSKEAVPPPRETVAAVAPTDLGPTDRGTEDRLAEKEESPRSRVHPDSVGRDYPMLPAAEVALTSEEEEVFRQIGNAKTAEKAFRVIKPEMKRWLPFLHRALRSTNREVRIQAAVMLGLLKDRSRETIEAMRDALILDRDPDVRAMVARSFLAIPAERAVDLLIRVLEADPYEAARANAAWALGESSDRKAVAPLIRALQDEDTFVRLRAVSALMKFQAREAVPGLVARLSDKSPMVRERAHMALKKITGKNLPADEEAWRRALRL